ncbi:hypothetical protein [Sutcliffiella cohnii]|uniref:hypothetical protein n=1 Tax=Sutcliffiella cohnii TaxID=33932 RepID=UPI0008342B4D|nr:hypothetical protein [Sutcliffiella cohnii]
MEHKANRSGFTKLGFTKSGFGACAHWNFCNMGKNDCYYASKDPKVKDYCHCYQRNHLEIKKEEIKLSSELNRQENELVRFDTELSSNISLIGKSKVTSENLRVNQQYLLALPKQNSGTHFLAYRMTDGKLLGCYESTHFEIVGEIEENNNEAGKKEESASENIEQLSLF